MYQACFTVSSNPNRPLLVAEYIIDPTKYQTEEDKAIIRGLIERYITDTRTIIL
jgi:hypothetical protein